MNHYKQIKNSDSIAIYRRMLEPGAGKASAILNIKTDFGVNFKKEWLKDCYRIEFDSENVSPRIL